MKLNLLESTELHSLKSEAMPRGASDLFTAGKKSTVQLRDKMLPLIWLVSCSHYHINPLAFDDIGSAWAQVRNVFLDLFHSHLHHLSAGSWLCMFPSMPSTQGAFRSLSRLLNRKLMPGYLLPAERRSQLVTNYSFVLQMEGKP